MKSAKPYQISILSVILCFGLAACGGGDNSAKPEEVTYESICNDYSQQLKDAVPTLVGEFEEESADESNESSDVEIYMSKIDTLAEIYNDGVMEMTELAYDDMSEESEATYDEYGEQLTQVYEECCDNLAAECGVE